MYKINPYIGINDTENKIDYRVDNPFISLTGMKEEKNTAGTAVIGYYVPAANVTRLGTYSVDEFIDSLFTDTGDIVGGTTLNTPFGVNEWLVGKLVEVQGVYDAGRDEYSLDILTELKTEAPATNASPLNGVIKVNATGQEVGEITSTEWNALYGSDKEFTMDKAAASAKAFATAGSLLEGTNGAYTAYAAALEALATSDADYLTEFDVGSGNMKSALKAAYESLKEGILEGSKTQDDVDDFKGEIGNLYLTDIAAFKTSAEQVLADFVVSTAKDQDAVHDRDAVYARHEEAKELYGNPLYYPCTSVTEINTWYRDSRAYIGQDQANTTMGDLLNSDIKTYAKGLYTLLDRLPTERRMSETGDAEFGEFWAYTLGAVKQVIEKAEFGVGYNITFQGDNVLKDENSPSDMDRWEKLFYTICNSIELPSGVEFTLDEEIKDPDDEDTVIGIKWDLVYGEISSKEDLDVVFADLTAIYNELVSMAAELDAAQEALKTFIVDTAKSYDGKDAPKGSATGNNALSRELRAALTKVSNLDLGSLCSIDIVGNETNGLKYKITINETHQGNIDNIVFYTRDYVVTVTDSAGGNEKTFSLLEGEASDFVNYIKEAFKDVDGK